MISTNGIKRKPLDNQSPQINSTKRFRSAGDDDDDDDDEHSNEMIINNSKQAMSSESRQLQYELQCQEALLVLMQKLKNNQKLISQTNNLKQRTTVTTPVNTATKLNSVPSTTKLSNNSNNRSTPTKPPHPNQYTVNRTTTNSQLQPTKNSLALPQATRQSNSNSTIPQTATRLSSTNINSTKPSSTVPTSNSNNTNNSKNNGMNNDQHLINAKLALRKQLEQTLLQIPTPKPTTCDLTYIPGINGWAEFLTSIGLEQAYNTYSDFINRRLNPETSFHLPYICAQCGTDWSITWHEVSSSNENESEEKIFCDRCRKTSQKKILKQDHSNRLRQAFVKAVQQEKELDAKFQHSTSLSSSSSSSSSTTVKQPSSSSSSSHNKHSSKNVSTKINSTHQSSVKHSTNNHNHHSNSKSNSSKQQQQAAAAAAAAVAAAQLPPTLPVDALTSTLAALPTNEQIEFFQKHILSNMFPLAFANQAAAAAALSPKAVQQQQQALAASLPAMAASLMRQTNPAQYLLDMIPQAAKQQQQQQQQQQQHHHHRHSK